MWISIVVPDEASAFLCVDEKADRQRFATCRSRNKRCQQC